MNNILLLTIIIILFIILIIINNTIENYDNTTTQPTTLDAINNITNMINDNKITSSNIEVTNNIKSSSLDSKKITSENIIIKETSKFTINACYILFNGKISEMKTTNQYCKKIYEDDKYGIFNLSFTFEFNDGTKLIGIKNIVYNGVTYKIPSADELVISPASLTLISPKRADKNTAITGTTKDINDVYKSNTYGNVYNNLIFLSRITKDKEKYYVICQGGILEFSNNIWHLIINGLILEK